MRGPGARQAEDDAVKTIGIVGDLAWPSSAIYYRTMPSSRTVVAVPGGCSWWIEPILELLRDSQSPKSA